MAESVAFETQKYFHKITKDSDRESFYKALVENINPIEAKRTDIKPATELTVLKMAGLRRADIVTNHVSGPGLSVGSSVLLSFESQLKYLFASGVIVEVMVNKYIIELNELYELRSRVFRAPIPKIFDAVFELEQVNRMRVNTLLHLTDVSTGGFGAEFMHRDRLLFSEGSLIIGNLKIGNSAPIKVHAHIKYCNKKRQLQNSANLCLGCEVEKDENLENILIKFVETCAQLTEQKPEI